MKPANNLLILYKILQPIKNNMNKKTKNNFNYKKLKQKKKF